MSDRLRSNWSVPRLLAALPHLKRLDDGTDLLACRLSGTVLNRSLYLYLYGDDPGLIHFDLEDASADRAEWDGAVERGGVRTLAELQTIASHWLLGASRADRERIPDEATLDGTARYILHRGVSYVAIVDVAIDSASPAGAIDVACHGDGFRSQGHIEEASTSGYEDWKAAAVIGARYASDILGLTACMLRVTRIEGLGTDTTPASVAAATVLAIFDALRLEASPQLRHRLDEVVAKDDMALLQA